MSLVVSPNKSSDVWQVLTSLLADGYQAISRHEERIRSLGMAEPDARDVEHVHKARVATRRLRSDLRTFGDLFEAGWRDQVRGELQWLGSALGTVRDADVLASWLRSEAVAIDDRDRPALTDLLADLARERAAGQRDLVTVLGSQRYRRLMEELITGARRLPLSEQGKTDVDRPAKKLLPALVEAEWKRLESMVRRLGPEPSDLDLHKLRIRAKRVRYAAEAVEAEVGGQARALAKEVTALQQVLGDLHDTLGTESWLRRAGTTGGAAHALVAGQLVERVRERRQSCREGWPAVWEKASRKKLRRWLRS